MTKTILLLILLLFQAAVQSAPQSSAPAQETWLEKNGITILLLVLTNGFQFFFQYFFNRKKTDTETAKISKEAAKVDTEVITSLTKLLKETRDDYEVLYEKVGALRDAKLEADDTIRDTQKKLEDCQERNATCEECQLILLEAKDAIEKVAEFLHAVDGAADYIQKLRSLSKQIDRRVEEWQSL